MNVKKQKFIYQNIANGEGLTIHFGKCVKPGYIKNVLKVILSFNWQGMTVHEIRQTVLEVFGTLEGLTFSRFEIAFDFFKANCVFRSHPDIDSGNIRTAFRNYPDSITAYPDTLSS